MSFLWPSLLWLLLAVPLLALTAFWWIRRGSRGQLAYPGLSRGATGMPAARRRRGRLLPGLLFLAALTALFLAAARPSAVVMVPRLNQTILLALDGSLSMRAGDVKPNRMEAVQSAARAFIQAQPTDTRIGVISFAATASVVQMPTVVRADTLAAVERLTLQRGTAVGSALLVGLGVLFPQEDLERWLTPTNRPGSDGRPPAPPRRPDRVEPGSHESAAIVLITDGQSTVGPLPAEVARLAADLGVRIYTVGVGTVGGDVIEGEGFKVRVKLDESILKDVATLTRGEYYLAESAEELNRISRSLGTRFVLERKETEITSWFTALGALLALAATALSLSRSNRIL